MTDNLKFSPGGIPIGFLTKNQKGETEIFNLKNEKEMIEVFTLIKEADKSNEQAFFDYLDKLSEDYPTVDILYIKNLLKI